MHSDQAQPVYDAWQAVADQITVTTPCSISIFRTHSLIAGSRISLPSCVSTLYTSFAEFCTKREWSENPDDLCDAPGTYLYPGACPGAFSGKGTDFSFSSHTDNPIRSAIKYSFSPRGTACSLVTYNSAFRSFSTSLINCHDDQRRRGKSRRCEGNCKEPDRKISAEIIHQVQQYVFRIWLTHAASW